MWNLFAKKPKNLVPATPITRRGPGRPPGAKNKAPARPTTAVEREELRFLRELRRTDPARYREIMLARLGLGGEKAGDSPTALGRLLQEEVIADFREFRKSKSRRGADGTDEEMSPAQIIQAVSQGVQAFAMLRQPQPQAAAPTQPQQQPQPQPQAQPPQPAAPPGAEEFDPPPADERDLSGWLLAHLQGKQPRDAALWLGTHPSLRAFAGEIVRTPDAAIVPMLALVRVRHPELAGFVDHLEANRDWTIATAQALRQLVAEAQAQQVQEQSPQPVAASVNGSATNLDPSLNVGL